MKILYQIAIIFSLCLLGEIISALLPFTFPSSVTAMLLLTAALFTGWLKIDHIREKSDFLLSNMAFFFIPVTSFRCSILFQRGGWCENFPIVVYFHRLVC